ncbi:hypothetical protein [Aulosira sp. FACHB-615]|uniref:hypothetical protein n=1 Tax=Aulosira sp. FACHB-615 TaxID=2692777 RepID=UPI0016839CBB|nr:hypothetical protein [Aulosira sp. FACHB-615]MBD2492605.1 hypothetical protein [Aulosira sp. FACHB-615]
MEFKEVVAMLPSKERSREVLRSLLDEQIEEYKKLLSSYFSGESTNVGWYGLIKCRLEEKGVLPDIAHYLASARDDKKLEDYFLKNP